MKVAFITGGSSGIGKEVVSELIANNICVGILDINSPFADESEKNLFSEKLLFTKGDVSKITDIKNAIQRTYDQFGEIDIVITNAGIHLSHSIFDIREADFQKVMDINLKGTIFTIKESLPYFNKMGGKIILLGSDQCFIGKPNNLAYGASKGAIGQITKSLSLELAPLNISVNAVCPGTVDTPLTRAALQRWADREFNGDFDRALEKENAEFPVGRIGTASEVADMISFIALKSSSFTTGSLFTIDGGYTAK